MPGRCFMENEDLQVDNINHSLDGKIIALCVTGGIAAIEAPKLARHLRRYGAKVIVYATPNTFHFVGKTSLEWGAGQEIISELGGVAEHICFYDAILVAPATLNTINKIFRGIADNPVTTLIASALGRKTPVYLAPTMHESLYQNPFLIENLANATKYGIKLIEPRISEGKAKMPKLEKIVATIIKDFGGNFNEKTA